MLLKKHVYAGDLDSYEGSDTDIDADSHSFILAMGLDLDWVASSLVRLASLLGVLKIKGMTEFC